MLWGRSKHLEKNFSCRKILVLQQKLHSDDLLIEKDRQKTTATKKWIDAINNHGEFGRWEYLICRNPSRVNKQLSKLVGGEKVEHVLDGPQTKLD